MAGKPYHPACFTCVVCNESLDGIPFTVDAANQIHCIDDFHRRFAPRCSVCRQPIMPTPGQEETVRVVALDRRYFRTNYFISIIYIYFYNYFCKMFVFQFPPGLLPVC